MSFSARVLADSVSPAGYRLTSIEGRFPRFILAEVNTHRVFTRSSASSRAIPVAKNLAKIREAPFIPDAFGANQKGMQAGGALEDAEQIRASAYWKNAMDDATKWAGKLAEVGVHKQWANRLAETFAWHTAIITSTEWPNWDNLRCNSKASPEIRVLAEMMRTVRNESKPNSLSQGEWHTPLVSFDDEVLAESVPNKGKYFFPQISCGRCARVSYLTHDGRRDFSEDLGLFRRLSASGHRAPLEHAARPMTIDELGLFQQPIVMWDEATESWSPTTAVVHGQERNTRHFLGNIEGWVQYRKLIPGEDVFRDEETAP
jgi:hypothetical protein